LREQGWNAGFLPKNLGEGDLELVLDAQKPTFFIAYRCRRKPCRNA